MLAIIDYGVGNLFSIKSSFARVGVEAVVTSDKKIIQNADHVMLPGVGAYCDAAKKLRETGLGELVKEEVKKGKPVMGICLGMQMLFEKSYEYGEYDGLGLLKGNVVGMQGVLPEELKIPHIGWNDTVLNGDGGVFDEGCYYFVHSYHYETDNKNVALYSDYGKRFVAAVRRDNVFGAQFHPEKSGDTGLRILKRFGDLR